MSKMSRVTHSDSGDGGCLSKEEGHCTDGIWVSS